MSSAPTVRLERPREGVALLTFDRPPVNALDPAGYDAAAGALRATSGDPEVRVVVLTGGGTRAFTAGTDTDTLAATGARLDQGFASARRFFEALGHHRNPMVAALNGPAVGGGAMIASQCDVLLAVPGAYLSLPELQLGFPGGGSHLLDLVPRFVALRMLLLGERLPAADALRFGILHSIVEPAELLPVALDRAVEIAHLDPEAVLPAREAIRRRRADATLDGYAAEMAGMEQILRH